jgi:hypothetical protein
LSGQVSLAHCARVKGRALLASKEDAAYIFTCAK